VRGPEIVAEHQKLGATLSAWNHLNFRNSSDETGGSPIAGPRLPSVDHDGITRVLAPERTCCQAMLGSPRANSLSRRVILIGKRLTFTALDVYEEFLPKMRAAQDASGRGARVRQTDSPVTETYKRPKSESRRTFSKCGKILLDFKLRVRL